MTLEGWRLEELSLNSSAPPGQLLYDGWLLRMLPGKAKRARSINAIYASRLPLADKIAHCERLYADAGMPAIFRVTPFAQPPELDSELAARGYERFDDTAVESTPMPSMATKSAAEAMALAEWVEAVGELRQSPALHRDSHLARLRGMPLKLLPVALRANGRIAATGLAILEHDCVGLFDIVTAEAQRRRGHARQVVAALLAQAASLGARHAYLQVDAANTPARNLYAQFGFAERYRYWYRGRPGEAR